VEVSEHDPSEVEVTLMNESDTRAVVAVAEASAGVGYYDAATVASYLQRSRGARGSFAYVARQATRVVGFRFSFPPGSWAKGRGAALHPSRWGAATSEAAYFQSCFVHPDYTARGIGRRLATRALADLRDAGAVVVVAHSWLQSPHQSSRRYLERLGFRAVATCPDYWIDVDYTCPRCGRPCRCTAVEMVCKVVGGY